jgi:acetoin utilization protein AcuB
MRTEVRQDTGEATDSQHGVRVLTAADVMSSPVVTVSTTDSLWDAWGLIYRSGFRHLVVVEGTRCVGVLDDRRIVTEWPLGPAMPHRRSVGDVVSRRWRIVVATTPVHDLARIMLEERIDSIPVVNDRGEAVGLVTASDLLALVAERPSTISLEVTA